MGYETAETYRRGIRRIRKERGPTLEDLSAAMGLTGAYISRLLTGSRQLSLSHAEELSQALGIPVSGLLLSTEDYSLLHDRKLTPEENRKLEVSMYDHKRRMVARLIRKREKKPVPPGWDR